MNKKCPACGCGNEENGRTGSGACSAGAAVRAGRARPTPTTPPPGTSDPSSDGCCRRKPSSICRVRAGPSGARRRGSGDLAPCEVVDEIHRVVFVDGIWIARDLVVLIACSELHRPVLAPRPRRDDLGSEVAALAHQRRLTWWSRTAAPKVRLGSGEGVAGDEVQRCTFHAFCQVRRKTTRRPNLQAERSCTRLQRNCYIETLHQADWWVERYMQWCEFWADFLEETSIVDGRKVYTHGRIREASRSGADAPLVSKGVLFTYLDPGLTAEGPMPAMNNRIEGGINAQLRAVLRNHRGLKRSNGRKPSLVVLSARGEPKAWPTPLREMPTDADVERLRDECYGSCRRGRRSAEMGRGLSGTNLHHTTRYPCTTSE